MRAESGSTTTGNVAALNRFTGLSGSGGVIRGNTAYSNGGEGIRTVVACGIIGNSSYGNGGRGIFATYGSTVRLEAGRFPFAAYLS